MAFSGSIRTRSWSDSPENRRKADHFALALSEGAFRPPAARPACLPVLWKKYSTSELPLLKPRTRRAYSAAWVEWERSFPNTRRADSFTVGDIDRFTLSRRQCGRSTSYIGGILTVVKLVFRWAQSGRSSPDTLSSSTVFVGLGANWQRALGSTARRKQNAFWLSLIP